MADDLAVEGGVNGFHERFPIREFDGDNHAVEDGGFDCGLVEGVRDDSGVDVVGKEKAATVEEGVDDDNNGGGGDRQRLEI